MVRVRLPIVAILSIAAVAACGRSDPVASGANDTEALPAANEPAPNPSGAPPAEPAQNTDLTVETPTPIPAALHGRWGLTPGDCTSTRGDAKGLLIVSASELAFYESRAVPAAGVQADADSISGDFRFTGEGQTWSKYQSLKLQQQDLVRTETEPTASYTYAKCK